MTSTISVALCTFNGERFIAEQVESILGQSLLPNEIILSDDGSADETVEVAERVMAGFAASHLDAAPTLRVLRNPTALGVVRNFEQAVIACTGDLVVLCDQDDRWHPDRLSGALAVLDADSTLVMVHANARLVDDSGSPLGYSLFEALGMTDREREEIRSGDALAALLGRNLVTGATTMFRRELLERALPFPSQWVHDEWLAIVAAATGRIDFLDAQVIDYRQHSSNAIGARRIGLRAKFEKLRQPREERNRGLVDRAAVLVDRLAELGGVVSERNLERARAKLAHEQARLRLPARHISRLPPVMREVRTGGYAKYGLGMQDALRDLVQPAR